MWLGDKPVEVILSGMVVQPEVKKSRQILCVIFKYSQQPAEFSHIGHFHPPESFQAFYWQKQPHTIPIKQDADSLERTILFQQFQSFPFILMPEKQIRAKKRLPHHIPLVLRQHGKSLPLRNGKSLQVIQYDLLLFFIHHKGKIVFQVFKPQGRQQFQFHDCQHLLLGIRCQSLSIPVCRL